MAYGRYDGRAIPGSNHIRYVSDAGAVRSTSEIPVAYLSSEAQFVLTRPMTMIVHADETFPNSIEDVWFAFLRSTRQYWLDWVRYLSVPTNGREAVIRAAITLKLPLRGDRRHRRGADHLDPRGAGDGPHRGLPVLLAARRLFHRPCAEQARRDADHGAFPRLHALGHRHGAGPESRRSMPSCPSIRWRNGSATP